jgi:FkbM family methyltransferase
MKRILKKIIGLFKSNYKKSYSESGEDMIINKILNKVERGFYVDVGANNPKELSNTHFFYRKGWTGINIDAMPGSMKKFNRIRPRDINLEIPISDKNEMLTFYMFKWSAHNSFDEKIAIKREKKLIGTKELQTEKLAFVLDKHVKNRKIDFMTIDVEGLDFRVLKSNDWIKYRPKLIVVELFGRDVDVVPDNEITKFLTEQGYKLLWFSNYNIFFIENEYYKVRYTDLHS